MPSTKQRLQICMLLCLSVFVRSATFAEPPIQIVTTTGMIADIVSGVAGPRAEVKALIGSGVDPHLYKPTRSDIASLMSAEMVFYNGLLLEGKMTDALIRVATSGRKVYAVSELVDQAELLEPKEFQGHYDPHLWMDPKLWIRAVEVVRTKLTEFNPAGADDYQRNAQGITAEFERLHLYAESALKSVPEQARVLVTAHDAFNYFGRRYGFEVLGIQGISTESEAGVQDIERLVALLVARKIGAVFIESTVSDRNIKALIEGAAAKNHEVRIGGELFSDAMGKPGTYEGTYVGMIDHNVSRIAAALGGTIPPGGMQGKLQVK